MHFKDVLLALTTYSEPTPISVLDDAVSLAVALGARISAIACEVKFQVPGSILGKTVLDIPAMVAAEIEKSAANAERLLGSFQEAAEKSGVFQQRIREHCLTAQVPDTLIEHARLRDLTIVPVPEGDHVEQWYSESIIFGSGRPTKILPPARGKAGPASVETVIAWRLSAQAYFGADPVRFTDDALDHPLYRRVLFIEQFSQISRVTGRSVRRGRSRSPPLGLNFLRSRSSGGLFVGLALSRFRSVTAQAM